MCLACCSHVENVLGDLAVMLYLTLQADAFEILTSDVFTNASGDRPDVPNFAILITGGLLFSEFTLPLAYKVRHHVMWTLVEYNMK